MYNKNPEKPYLNDGDGPEVRFGGSVETIINPVAEREIFVSDLVDLLRDSSLSEKDGVLSLVFFHSIEDGMRIAKRLGLSNSEIFKVLVSNADSTDRVVKELINEVEKDKKYLNGPEQDVFNLESTNFSVRVQSGKRKIKAKIPKTVEDRVKDYYTPFISQKRVRESAGLEMSEVDRVLADLFKKNESLRSKLYYAYNVVSYVKEKTGKGITLGGASYLPENEVKRIFGEYGLSFEEALKSGAIKQKKESTEIYHILKKEAQSALEKDIDLNLEQRGYKKEDYKIVERDKKFTIEFGENERKEGKTDYYNKEKLEVFKNLFLDTNADKNHVAWGLAGVSGEEAMKFRRELLDSGVDKNHVAWGLAGVSGEEAMKFRRELLDSGADKNYVALGLTGVQGEEAMAMRREFLDMGVDKSCIARSLAGVSGEESMKFRREFLDRGANKGYVVWGLAGVSGEESMKFRRELLDRGANKGYVAWGLAGVQGEEAMAMRRELLDSGADRGYIARSLAGVSGEEAMKFRRKLLNMSTSLHLIAQSLAGVQGEEAMAMRRELLDSGADKNNVAWSLAGVQGEEAMKFRRELVDVHDIPMSNTYFSGDFEIEVLISKNIDERLEYGKQSQDIFSEEYKKETLSKLRELLESGANKDDLAKSLAGVHGEDAMEFRRELLRIGANKDYVAWGLEGVSGEEAMKFRRKLLDSGADKSYIAWGLAGVQGEEAMAMRRELLDEDLGFMALGITGVQGEDAMEFRRELLDSGKDTAERVAHSLAGVQGEEAMKFRRELLDSGLDNDCIARSLEGVSGEEAMKLRYELLDRGVDKKYIAQSLAGVHGEEAMRLRSEFLGQGVDVNVLAHSLAGVTDRLSTSFRLVLLDKGASLEFMAQSVAGLQDEDAMHLRSNLKSRGLSEEKIYQYAFCNSSSSIYMTRVFEANNSNGDLGEHVNNLLNKLALVKYPDSIKESEFLEEYGQELSEKLSRSSRFAVRINKLISEDPTLFFDDIRAKGGKIKSWEITTLAHQLFPSIKQNKERESKSKGGGSLLRSVFSSERTTDFEGSNIPSADTFFGSTGHIELSGGDPSAEPSGSLIEFRQSVSGLLCTDIALSGNRQNSLWESVEIPISDELEGPVEEVTGEIGNLKLREFILPNFSDSKIVEERIKLLDKDGGEVEFDFSRNQMGQIKISAKANFSRVIYSQEKQVVPSIPNDVSNQQYQSFKKDFEKRYGNKGTDKILDLPPELQLFIESIKHLSPTEKLVEIEEMVRRVSVYDMNNKDVMSLKKYKGNDERLSIMQMRLDEISGDGGVGVGKMYAGVCADFAMLSTALLREAGFVSGVVSGLKISGKSANVLNAHATSFILWPRSDGKYDMYTVDGTPDGRNVNEQGIIDSMRERSLRERIIEAQEKSGIVAEEAEKQLAEIEKILDSHDLESIKVLSNGQLENVLNNLLRYKVKKNHLRIITTILDAGKYSGINIDDKISAVRFIESEIKRERDRVDKISGNENAGKEFFDTVNDFVRRYKDEGNTTENAIKEIEEVFELSEKYLSETESKAAFATINYLKAKNLV